MGQLSYFGKLALKAHNSLVNMFILHHQLTYLPSCAPQPAPSRANAASTLTHVDKSLRRSCSMGEACAKAELQPLSSSSNKTAALCRKGLGHDETAATQCHFRNRNNSFSVWFLGMLVHGCLSFTFAQCLSVSLVAELKPNCCTNIYALGGLSKEGSGLLSHALKLPLINE